MFDLALFAKPLAGHWPLMATAPWWPPSSLRRTCRWLLVAVSLESSTCCFVAPASPSASHACGFPVNTLLRNMVVFSVISPQWFYTQWLCLNTCSLMQFEIWWHNSFIDFISLSFCSIFDLMWKATMRFWEKEPISCITLSLSFKKNILMYLEGRVTQRERSPMPWFTPYKVTMSRGEPIWSHRLLGVPHVRQGAHALEWQF